MPRASGKQLIGKPRMARKKLPMLSSFGPTSTRRKTKVFATTLGHNNETVADPR